MGVGNRSMDPGEGKVAGMEEVRGSWVASRQGCSKLREDEAHDEAQNRPLLPPPLAQLQRRLQHWCGELLTRLSPPHNCRNQQPHPHPLVPPTPKPLSLITSPRHPSTLTTHHHSSSSSSSSSKPFDPTLAPYVEPSSQKQQQQQLNLPPLPFLHLLSSFSLWSNHPQQTPGADSPAQPWAPLSLLRPLPFPSFPAAPPSPLPLAVLTQSPTPAAPATASSALPLLPPASGYGSANAKAELGRATWTLLHTLAAQLPEQPSRQQQRDARQLVELLTRIYPCGDCARHFTEIVKRDPPVVSSGPEFQAWMCRVHNTVNRSLGKPTFNCQFVASRWSPLDCGEGADAAAPSACAMSIGARQ